MNAMEAVINYEITDDRQPPADRDAFARSIIGMPHPGFVAPDGTRTLMAGYYAKAVTFYSPTQFTVTYRQG